MVRRACVAVLPLQVSTGVSQRVAWNEPPTCAAMARRSYAVRAVVGPKVCFEHNTCINAGGVSMQGEAPPRQSDPYPQPVGYHVWTWLIDPGTQPGQVYIRHNIFCAGYGAAICLIMDPADERKLVLVR